MSSVDDLTAAGWISAGSDGSYLAIETTYVNTGSNALNIDAWNCSSSADSEVAALPIMNAPINTLQITLSYRQRSGGIVKVGYLTDPDDATTFVSLEELPKSTSAYSTVTVDLSGAPVTAARIAIQQYTWYECYIDDIVVSELPSCVKPTGVTISDITNESAVVNWTSEADTWNVRYRVNGSSDDWTIESCEKGTSFSIDNLDPGTTYEVQVQTDCGGGDTSNWTDAVTFATNFCAPADQCIVNITLTDSYGDGWNGNKLEVRDALTDILLGTFTLPSGAASGNFSLNVCNGREINFVYVASGQYSTENGWIITDVNDEVIAEREGCNSGCTPTPGIIATHTVNCTVAPWKKPTNLAASEIGSKSVKLSWTENSNPAATTWKVAYKVSGNADFAEVDADSNPFTLSGLTPETEYIAKVRPVTGDATVFWSDEINFTTDVEFPAPTSLAASNITASSATINWTGTADSYNLMYAVSNSAVCDFESVEAWSVDNFAPFTAYDGDGASTYGVTNATFPNQQYTGSVITMDNDNEMGANWAAHSGTKFGCFMAANGSANNDFFITPEVTITDGSTFSFWARSVTDQYGLERMKVGVYSGNGAFSGYLAGSDVDYVEVPTSWTKYSYDLSAYVGQTIQLAINCVSNDAFALFIDEVSVNIPTTTWSGSTTGLTTTSYELDGLTPETNYIVQIQSVYSDGESKWSSINFTTIEDVPTPSALAVSDVAAKTAVLSWTENGTASAWEICLNDDETNLVAADSNPFTLTALTPETEYTAKVRAVNGEKRSNWSVAASFKTDVEFHAPSDLAVDNITINSAEVSWTVDAVAATASSFELQHAEATSTWNYYDNGTFQGCIGAGGAFYWGVMFPAGSYEGNKLLNVSIYDYGTMTGTITIYNDGNTAPAGDAVSTKAITLTGTHEMAEFSFNNLAIDNTKNVWVIVNNETGTDYPAAYSSEATTNPNGRWVSLDGTTWKDINEYGYSYPWMIRAEIGTGVEPSWTTVPDASSPTELTGLTPFTDYVVRVKAIYGTEGESLWKTTHFQTLNDNPVPSNISADLAADGATLTWDGNGDSYNVKYRIASSRCPAIFEEDFENGLGDWQAISNNTANAAGINSNAAMNGANGFRFSSYVSASNYNQYLISPELNSIGTLEFYYKKSYTSNEPFRVGYSSTGSDIADFTWGEIIAASSTSWEKFQEAIPDGTKYFAINYCPSKDLYYLYIDDICIYETTPAGAWQNLAVNDATATISGLTTNNDYEYQIQSVKGGNTSEWSDVGEFALLTLQDDATNNGNLLLNSLGKKAHVTLAGRTLYKDENWNTLTLPFNVTLTASTLVGATAKTLTDASMTGSTVSLDFGSAVDELEAGKPYIIKWGNASNIVNPEFANVVISSTLGQTISKASGNVKFIGYYDAFGITPANTDIYYLTADNKLKHTGKDRTLNALRAYFKFTEEVTSRDIVLDFGDGETTGIVDVERETKANEGWYTVDGKKLDKQPTSKGVYVNNGKKIVIK